MIKVPRQALCVLRVSRFWTEREPATILAFLELGGTSKCAFKKCGLVHLYFIVEKGERNKSSDNGEISQVSVLLETFVLEKYCLA